MVLNPVYYNGYTVYSNFAMQPEISLFKEIKWKNQTILRGTFVWTLEEQEERHNAVETLGSTSINNKEQVHSRMHLVR